jgi:hypothetical protein
MARAKKNGAKRAKTHKNGTPSVVPRPPPAALAYAPPPAPLAYAPPQRRNGRVKRAARRVTEKAKELKKTTVTGGQVAAAVGGTLGYTATAAVIVGRGWLSPIWTSAVLTTVGAGATYAAYKHEMPHATAFGAGWTLGGLAQATTTMIVHVVSEEDDKGTDKGTDKGKARNALGDGWATDGDDISHRLRLSEQRAKELDLELARARERLNPEMELAAA